MGINEKHLSPASSRMPQVLKKHSKIVNNSRLLAVKINKINVKFEQL